MTLPGGEFLQRFLLHILPKGFMRIRHYGYLANRVRVKRLEKIRACLKAEKSNTAQKATFVNCLKTPTEDKPEPCPSCKTGRLHLVGEIQPEKARRQVSEAMC